MGGGGVDESTLPLTSLIVGEKESVVNKHFQSASSPVPHRNSTRFITLGSTVEDIGGARVTNLQCLGPPACEPALTLTYLTPTMGK